MSATGLEFGAAALRLSGTCALALGWSAETFWQATPAELAAVVAALAPTATRALDAAGLRALEELVDG